jgi:hypothetical protein
MILVDTSVLIHFPLLLLLHEDNDFDLMAKVVPLKFFR